MWYQNSNVTAGGKAPNEGPLKIKGFAWIIHIAGLDKRKLQ